MEAGGFRFLDWQRIVVGSWLGVDAYGRWAAKSCGEHVPRQNGKTLGTTEPRMNWGAFALNELVLYTSHLQKTSTETFEDMASFFDQRKFHKYLKAIRTALGREAIEFRAGGKIKFLARTRNGGRGQFRGQLRDLLHGKSPFILQKMQNLTGQKRPTKRADHWPTPHTLLF